MEPAQSLGEIIAAGAGWLRAKNIDEAELLCEWLASHCLRLPRTKLPLSKKPSEETVDALRDGIRRLGDGEPVQYVIGEWDFRYLTLKTDKRALIPRPETEQLVELVLEEKNIWLSNSPHLCDIGTGTGAIAISIAHERPSSKITAVDCEEAALSLAKENAARCNVEEKIRFIHGKNCADAEPASFDAVVSNPPYIKSSVVDALPRLIKDFEPRTALDGGEDGLYILRSLIHDSAIALKRDGYLFLEIGADQGDIVRELMEDAGFSNVKIFSDFAGRTRFAKGRIE